MPQAHIASFFRIALAIAPICLSCSGDGYSTGPGTPSSNASLYALSTVDGKPLPVNDPNGPYTEVIGGSLSLRTDGTLTEMLQFRCKSSLPPGVSCTTNSADGKVVREARYSASEAWIEFANGVRFAAAFETNSVKVYYGRPLSGCSEFCPSYLFDFRR